MPGGVRIEIGGRGGVAPSRIYRVNDEVEALTLVRRLIRDAASSPEGILVDSEAGTCSFGGCDLGLTNLEQRLVLTLARTPGQPVAIPAIEREVFGITHPRSSDAVRALVYRLRKKLIHVAGIELETRRGSGLVLCFRTEGIVTDSPNLSQSTNSSA